MSELPDDFLRETLRGTALSGIRGVQVQEMGGAPYNSFYVSEDAGDYNSFSFPVLVEEQWEFPEYLFFEGAEYVPEEMAEDFWENLAMQYAIRWDQTSELEENFGKSYSRTVYITRHNFAEWCRDVLGSYVESAIESDPKHVVSLMLGELEPGLRRQLEEMPVDLHLDEDFLDLVHEWFMSSSESDREEVLDILRRYGRAMADTGEPPEVILEITRDDLDYLGIRKGTYWENAPWKLVRLKPSHLPEEGRRMRHCVGNMSYRYADRLIDGDIEIWSLRSKDNKPRFTLEVDSSYYDADEKHPDDSPGGILARQGMKARAIKQLKGKANRTPGYAQISDERKPYPEGVKWPEEIRLWRWLLKEKLDVSPDKVDDFPVWVRKLRYALIRREQAALDAANSGEMLRENPRRSFDEPYRPL